MVDVPLGRIACTIALMALLSEGIPIPLLAGAGGPSRQAATAAPDPAGLLARARSVMGFDSADNRVLHYRTAAASEQNYQSDRTYPPFFSAMLQQEMWFDPASGVLRVETQTQFPGSPSSPAVATLDDGRNAAVSRGGRSVPVARRQAIERNLSAWAVLSDWSAAKDVRLVGSERYRDYPRTVLSRETPEGPQKLYLDAKSGFPVKLDLVEPHYLWGQRHIEYLWTTWTMHEGAVLPGGTFRLADGAIEVSQTAGAPEFVTRQGAPSMDAPQPPAQPPPALPAFLQPMAPVTKQVSANTWLLSNPGYTEAVTLAGNTIVVFDATQGEERARQDADAIAKLFPGRHAITVVVTDLAWPHVAGVRYWVSQGATIVAHAGARAFLQQVVDRRWTLAPDSLEKRRTRGGSVRLNFVAAERSTTLAGGAIRIAPIDGIGSELALMAYVAGDRFLWASDYIQTLTEPSLYATEVMRAAAREGIEPERVAAEHLPLTDWKTVVAAQQKGHSSGRRPISNDYRSVSLWTRQLRISATNSSCSDGHAISWIHPNCFGCLPERPSTPSTVPSSASL
jgi:hypothetical protein